VKGFMRSVVLGFSILGALSVSTFAYAATNTVTYSCTGYPQYLQVPAGVTSLTFVATGGSGGGARGGFGGVLQGTLSVTPNEVLKLQVGCAPFKSNPNYPDDTTGAYGWASGGNGGIGSVTGNGGGGGGATGLSTDSGTTLIVAAGGGGNGAATVGLKGGSGGNGGSTGGSSGDAGGSGGALGGSSTPTGGAGGSANQGGGGGGGGLLGGGGGDGSSGAGGGGGGGLNLTDSTRVTNVTTSVDSSREDGSLVLTFNGLAPVQPTTFSCDSKQDLYPIPATAKALRVIAIGAKGGAAQDTYGTVLSDTTPGLGAGFDALITPDNFPENGILTVVVGCQGGVGQSASWFSSSGVGGAGGFGVFSGGNGGSGDKLSGTDPHDGAMGGSGGGGASGVFGGTVVPRFPLIVAGGGAGTGGLGHFIVLSNNGGSGGNAGELHVDNLDGSDGAGSGGGKGGKSTDTIISLDGSGAASGSNGGGGGGAGGGLETLDFGITSNAGSGASGIAAGGGGGMGGNSGPGGGNVIVAATEFRAYTYFNRSHKDGIILIQPLF
jgi:hypothetical protein